jgi:hypothetical protein
MKSFKYEYKTKDIGDVKIKVPLLNVTNLDEC